MKGDRNSQNKLFVFLENYAYLITIVSILLILFVTLLPFNFAIPDRLSFTSILQEFRQTTNYTDIIVNIILFLPFGLGLAILLNKSNRKIISHLIAAFCSSLCLSLIVEIGQLFLVSREPTIYDLLANSSGGLLGALFFFLLQKNDRSITHFLRYFSFFKIPEIQLKSLIILWLSYLFIVGLVLISVADSTKLSNWDTRYPLLVGNEGTGDRVWLGKITNLCISKKALNSQEIGQFLKTNKSCIILNNNNQSNDLLAAYFFNNSHSAYLDLTRNSPNLELQNKSPALFSDRSLIINKDNWFKTTFPVTKLAKEIQQSSQFTLFTTIATNNFKQEGPARIISLSRHHLSRNLTIGQWDRDLSIRLRMPLTGVNGKQPEIRWHDFFQDKELHQLAISYDGLRLRIYRDSLDNSKTLYFGAETAFFWSILAVLGEKIYLNADRNNFYLFLYYTLIFTPLGLLWGAIDSFLNNRFTGSIFVFVTGLIIPPLIIEIIIVNTSDRNFNFNYLLLGWLTLATSFFLTKIFLLTRNNKPNYK